MSDWGDKPNPGSDEALDQGCTCAVLDNAHGRGRFGNGESFWVNMECPVHGMDIDVEDDGG